MAPCVIPGLPASSWAPGRKQVIHSQHIPESAGLQGPRSPHILREEGCSDCSLKGRGTADFLADTLHFL